MNEYELQVLALLESINKKLQDIGSALESEDVTVIMSQGIIDGVKEALYSQSLNQLSQD